ncbi:M23 family metallopeptidase [Leucobacter sp. NPDC015123]|uniref:M23 family metallopeptidase n=1 Tax=Leucobacter sp. NPDC015123 TaxID=3364129 RepID=UPI0036F49D69
MAIVLSHPIPGAPLSDAFGWRDTIPGVIGAGLHNGQDYKADTGDLIRAAQGGTVVYNGWDPTGGGWMIRINHGGGYHTLYLHMREQSPLVRVGQQVSAGAGIGYVGSSGASTGPHLHFMLEKNGTYVDPVPHIKTPAKPNTSKPASGQEEDEDMIFIRRNDQAKVYAWSPLRGTKRPVGTTEWNAIRRAYGAAGLKLPLINTTAAETKHFGI